MFQDNRRFIGINLDLYKNEEELNISEKALERIHDFQFVKINDKNHAQQESQRLHERLQSLNIYHRINSIHQPERLQDLIYQSPRIRSLKWYSYQNMSLPSTFNPEFLVELDMSSSKLRKLWEGTKVSDFDENFHFF